VTRAIAHAAPALSVAALALTAACAAPVAAPAFDVLHRAPPAAPHVLAGRPVSDDDYARFVAWGADWFRGETFGGERAVTDVLGILDGVVEVPCDPGPPGCYRPQSVFDVFVRALDALDGETGNLFTGNGGPTGSGYTSDLVLRFPPGTRLFGSIPVPEELHTGLDVEAGEPWPVGIVSVVAPPQDQGLGYLHAPSRLGAGRGSDTRMRLGVTCALCHYSLDIDGDGRADLKSARLGHATAGSPYRPEHAWAIGNQDLHFGWLLALSANPIVAFTVLSGPVGSTDPRDALAFVRWVKDEYVRAPQAVFRQIAISMLLHPRGSADDTPDALHQGVQMPSIYTLQNLPYNSDGSLENASDRNNVVWTGSIDFTGLVGLSADRAAARGGILFWEPTSVYTVFSAAEYADLITRHSPAAAWDPALQRSLARDILGESDGVPGLLRPDSIAVIRGPSGALPGDVYDLPANEPRRRTAADYGEDAAHRAGVLAVLGTRVRTPPAIRASAHVAEYAAKYGVNADEFFTNVVSLMLDWQTPPPNVSSLLAAPSAGWALVERGYGVFRQERCDACHAGPFLTDNRVNRLSDEQSGEFGLSAPSTAGWIVLGRDLGPAIGTDPHRTYGTRPQELFLSPGYDPATGLATATGSPLRGFLGDPRVGYKTATLRNLWATAPYLHDGSVGVAFAPGVTPPPDLRARLLAARDRAAVVYGMGPILDAFEQGQYGARGEIWRRPDAALSLQALLLEPERRKIVASSRALTVHVSPGGVWPAGGPSPERISMASVGVSGVGHEFWVHDVAGGDRITALVAFLLALDDRPCELPGEPSRCVP
jgi:hypothetical protein